MTEKFPLAEASEDGLEAANQAADTVKNAALRATEAARDAAHRAADSARNACHTVKVKADDSVTCSREFVRRNPFAVVLGALAVGAAVGYLIATRQQEEQTLRERFVEDPLNTARDTVYAALAPMSRRLHDHYGSARDGAGRALERLHRIPSSRAVDSWGKQLCRAGNNLKFW